MQKIKVTSVETTFGSECVLDLTEEQYLRRKYLVKKEGKGYRPIERISFKRGEEVILLAGDVSKKMLSEGEVEKEEIKKEEPKENDKQKLKQKAKRK